jgi:hypothetical protein
VLLSTRRRLVLGAVALATAAIAAIGVQAGASASAAAPASGCSAVPNPQEDLHPTPLGPEGVVPLPRPDISWRALPGIDTYVVNINFADTNSRPVVPGEPFEVHGTTLRPPNLPVHTPMLWWVKGECGDGTYTGFSTQRFFTVEPQGPTTCLPAPQPGLPAPVTSGPSGTVDDLQPTFSWNAVPGAQWYTFVVVDAAGNEIAHANLVRATYYTRPIPLPVGVPLRWRVSGESVQCGHGAVSADRPFRIDPAAGSCPITDPPAAYGPQGTLIVNNGRMLFRWSTVPGATGYTLSAWTSDGTQLVYRTGITTPAFMDTDAVPAGVTVQWTVTPESPCGPGPASVPMAFQIR